VDHERGCAAERGPDALCDCSTVTFRPLGSMLWLVSPDMPVPGHGAVKRHGGRPAGPRAGPLRRALELDGDGGREDVSAHPRMITPPGGAMRIFGREPAVWLALVGAIISAIGAFVVHLSPEVQGGLNAVVALLVGVLTAVVTRDGVSAAVLGLIKGLFMLMIAFGLLVSADDQAVIYALAAAVLAAFVRTQAVAPSSRV
jgi:hypothetical protein